MRSPTARRASRLFLLSPASLAGVRGRPILEGEAGADFMEPLGRGGSVRLGDVYAFISPLNYRGKRTYARRFGRSGEDRTTVFAITSTRGLLPDDTPLTMDELRGFASTGIETEAPDYLEPLISSARAAAADHELECVVALEAERRGSRPPRLG